MLSPRKEKKPKSPLDRKLHKSSNKHSNRYQRVWKKNPERDAEKKGGPGCAAPTGKPADHTGALA